MGHVQGVYVTKALPGEDTSVQSLSLCGGGVGIRMEGTVCASGDLAMLME